jgi:6-phosphogluconolactonase (cycloisomerase 2 family)
MQLFSRGAAVAAFAAAALALAAGPAAAATHHRAGARHDIFVGNQQALFVQTDGLTGNQIAVYARSASGTLTLAHTYPTGGNGGQLVGSAVDFLASQGSLVYDAPNHALYAVNAGSNTVSVFSVFGTQLVLRQVLPSGGTFPVSVAVQNNVVYVLNALGGGTLAGFREFFGTLVAIAGSSRALGLDPNETPQFTSTPGQVAFTPDGSQLIVTTKGNGSDIDVFGVSPFGLLSPSPVVNPEPGAVPFAVAFTPAGWLAVSEAGTNSVALFALGKDGTAHQLSVVATGKAATCWITADGNVLFASNAGGAAVSTVNWTPWGPLTLATNTTTDAGTVDSVLSPDARFLYVQTGAGGIVDEFAIGAGGALTSLGSVTVAASAGGEGIAAS